MTIFKTVATLALTLSLFAACTKQGQQAATDSALAQDTAARVAIKEGQGTAIVRAIDTVAKSITLDHGTIPNIMEAMTMEYRVNKSEALRGIHIGDSVSFTLQDRGEGDYVVTQITPTRKQQS